MQLSGYAPLSALGSFVTRPFPQLFVLVRFLSTVRDRPPGGKKNNEGGRKLEIPESSRLAKALSFGILALIVIQAFLAIGIKVSDLTVLSFIIIIVSTRCQHKMGFGPPLHGGQPATIIIEFSFSVRK